MWAVQSTNSGTVCSDRSNSKYKTVGHAVQQRELAMVGQCEMVSQMVSCLRSQWYAVDQIAYAEADAVIGFEFTVEFIENSKYTAFLVGKRGHQKNVWIQSTT